MNSGLWTLVFGLCTSCASLGFLCKGQRPKTKDQLISFFDLSKSFAAFAYCFSSYNRGLVCPTASPDYDHQKFFLHHHRADGRPDSSPRRGHVGECPSNGSARPYQRKRFRARCCQPGQSSPGKPTARAALLLRACEAARSRLPWRPVAQTHQQIEPSVRLFPGATRCYESACPGEY